MKASENPVGVWGRHRFWSRQVDTKGRLVILFTELVQDFHPISSQKDLFLLLTGSKSKDLCYYIQRSDDYSCVLRRGIFWLKYFCFLFFSSFFFRNDENDGLQGGKCSVLCFFLFSVIISFSFAFRWNLDMQQTAISPRVECYGKYFFMYIMRRKQVWNRSVASSSVASSSVASSCIIFQWSLFLNQFVVLL